MEFEVIKLLDDDVDFSNIRPYDWDLVLNGKPYYVCRIPGYAHTISYIGGRATREELWCYPRDEKPSIDNLVEYDLKNPVSWGIEYHEDHKTKCKWDEVFIRDGEHTVITRNGKKFYTVGGRRDYSVIEAMSLLYKIQDHPLEFDTIDFDKKMIGRKIWYRSQPGIITNYVHGECCVMVVPDGFDRWETPPEFENDDIPYYEPGDQSVKIDCLKDGNVWWFRD